MAIPSTERTAAAPAPQEPPAPHPPAPGAQQPAPVPGSESVLGEEDPGASLDLVLPATAPPSSAP